MRVLVAGAAAAGDVIELDEEESRHLRVRRAEPGERVQIRDGAGLVGTGDLDGATDRWRVRVRESSTVARPAALVLAVAAGDKDRFAWLVEKAAELGATDLIPLETDRTAGVASRLRGMRAAKLARRALESVKQSGAAWAPVIHEAAAFAEFLGRDLQGTRWIADAEGEAAPASVAGPVWVLVGPEGGFTGAERAAAAERLWTPVCLGPHILRFETAAIAALANVAAARRRSAT